MGIAQSLLSAWSSALESNSTTRFLKISIQDEQAVLALSVAQRSSNSAKDDFALIEEKGQISPTEPCYILYKLDKGKGWCFITYVSLLSTRSGWVAWCGGRGRRWEEGRRDGPSSFPAPSKTSILLSGAYTPLYHLVHRIFTLEADPLAFLSPPSQVPDGAKVREKVSSSPPSLPLSSSSLFPLLELTPFMYTLPSPSRCSTPPPKLASPKLSRNLTSFVPSSSLSLSQAHPPPSLYSSSTPDRLPPCHFRIRSHSSRIRSTSRRQRCSSSSYRARTSSRRGQRSRVPGFQGRGHERKCWTRWTDGSDGCRRRVDLGRGSGGGVEGSGGEGWGGCRIGEFSTLFSSLDLVLPREYTARDG